MTDLIDRQVAIDKFEPWLKVRGYSEGELNMLKAVLYEIRFLPSASAVEIVRCRECKHNPNDTWFECPIAHLPYNEDRWCWKGERKDG